MESTKSFSAITKTILAEIDSTADHLFEIGYFNQEQREFLDKFVHKSEVALSAVNIPAEAAIRQPSTNSAPTSLNKIEFGDAKEIDTRIAMDGIRVNDKKAHDDTTEIESNLGSTNVTECRIPGTQKWGIAFVPASDASTSFSPEHISPASTSTTAARKGDKLCPMKTGKTVKFSTSNEDGGIVDEYAPRLLGSDGKGEAMMQKMGWNAGMGLGKGIKGIREPVRLTVNTLGIGLGSSTADAIVDGSETIDGQRVGWTEFTPISEHSPALETFDETGGTWGQNNETDVKERDRDLSRMW